MSAKSQSTRIEDYAIIGDCHTAALVSRQGSIDWLCLPRFDSPACLAALLGKPDNGCWHIRPSVPVRNVRRRYRENTLILETDLETEHGLVTLIDFMSLRASAPRLVRIVKGKRGQVPMRMELIIRFDYGSIVPWVRKVEGGIRAVAGPDTVHCFSNVALCGKDLRTVADFTVSEGQSLSFTFAWSATHDSPPQQLDPWVSRCTYRGEWRDAVVRSLITLKALTYLPTGGMVAAPTTSLPEELGGVRNWDYRYCWVRDATYTLYALMVGGYLDEARAWQEWLELAVAGTPSEPQIMYGLAGERRLTELELDWLSGYAGSTPVRIGNAAHRQRQWDICGEVMDSMHLARKAGLPANGDAWRVQRALLGFLEHGWREPDEGIWEVRGPRRHFTHSKVMAWVAMDRGVRAVEEFGFEGEMNKWKALRDEIHDEVCARGFDPELNSFVQYYGSKSADASLLMLPSVGFLPADDYRMRGTVDLIRKTLFRDGFVYRYPTRPHVDGLPPGENAFLLCTFWLADNLVLQNRLSEARELFELMLDLRNDVGLLPEEYDPQRKLFLGNFPQAFSHVGLINTARNLSAAGGPVEARRQSAPAPAS